MLKSSFALAAIASLLLVGPASAAPQSWTFSMDGLQEVPQVATPGSGTCLLDFDDVSGDFDIACSFQDLIGSYTASHIHGPAAPGVNAGILINLPLTSGGGSSGTIGTMGTFTAQQLQFVLDELTYVNVHSDFRPGGEIRGQMVPEPTTALLLALGATALIARRRR